MCGSGLKTAFGAVESLVKLDFGTALQTIYSVSKKLSQESSAFDCWRTKGLTSPADRFCFRSNEWVVSAIDTG